MLFGEIFSIEEEKDGWAKGRAVLDHYPGYVRLDALGPIGPLPTHRVCVPRTFVYRDADMKSPPLLWLGMNARLAVGGHSGGYSRIENLGWIYSEHIVPVGMYTEDFTTLAEKFLGTPYLWVAGMAWVWIVPACCKPPCRARGLNVRATPGSRWNWAMRLPLTCAHFAVAI